MLVEGIFVDEAGADWTEKQITCEGDAIESAQELTEEMQELMTSWKGKAAENAKESAECIRLRMDDLISCSGDCAEWLRFDVQELQEADDSSANTYSSL